MGRLGYAYLILVNGMMREYRRLKEKGKRGRRKQ